LFKAGGLAILPLPPSLQKILLLLQRLWNVCFSKMNILRRKVGWSKSSYCTFLTL